MTFSSYKHHNTFKVLVSISPGGFVTFISELWGGRVSDRLITESSGKIALLHPGDNVMADWGFATQDKLASLGVTLNIPPFPDLKTQFSAREVTETRRYAEVRIPVERAIGRIKNYLIIQGIIPITIAVSASQMFTVYAHLTNFSPPVVELFKFIDIHDIIILYYIFIVMRLACRTCNSRWHLQLQSAAQYFRHYMSCVPVNTFRQHYRSPKFFVVGYQLHK